MKTKFFPSILSVTTVSAIIALLVPTGQADAAGISFNFASGPDAAAGGTDPGTPYMMGALDVAGVVALDHWNNLTGKSGTFGSLLDNTGASTSASVLWNSNGTYHIGPLAVSPGNFTMMKSHLDGRASGFGSPVDPTVTVSSLNAAIGSLYDVYVYFDAETANGSVLSNYTIGSTTYYIQDTTTFNGTFVQGTGTTAGTRTAGANYVLFSGLTGDSFTLTADSESFRAEISGVQVVGVPEPGSSLFILAGFTALAARRRKRA